MISTQIPGIYTSYQLSGIRHSGNNTGVVGLAAVCGESAEEEIYTVTTYTGAVTLLGAETNGAELCRVMFENGAGVIKVCPVLSEDTAGYGAALDTLMGQEDVTVMVTDSALSAVHTLMRDKILAGQESTKYRIGICEGTGNAAALVSAAKNINCERIILTVPGTGSTPGSAAAAVAAAVVTLRDPAVPLNGAVLNGISVGDYTDGDVTQLIQGGVTPIRVTGGETAIVRGITTRTLTSGEADATWREINTVLIIDNVIPGVRDVLRGMFSRAKNTQQTRGAIRTQVVVELENKVEAGIIDSYGEVIVTQNSADPTICDVEFEFAVAHGINQILLSAYITV